MRVALATRLPAPVPDGTGGLGEPHHATGRTGEARVEQRRRRKPGRRDRDGAREHREQDNRASSGDHCGALSARA